MDGDKYLLKDVNTTGEGDAVMVTAPQKTLQLIGKTTSGAGAATVIVEVTNDPLKAVWLPIGSLQLTLSTTASSEGFAVNSKWDYIRGNVSSISGTGAILSLIMSS